jgi:NAD(P)-dependent dehydrogenase (short-subunit alcohol dehydrogenase family)
MEGKIFLVTGCSGSIGGSIAQHLEKEGAKMILVGRNADALNEFVKDKLSKSNHIVLEIDLNNVKQISDLAKKVEILRIKIDGIVHAAGISDVRPLKLTTPEFIERVMRINFTSFIELIRCFNSLKVRNEILNIVGISAVGATQGNATKTAYCASKAAMNAAVKCLAIELAAKGVRINTVAPGATESKMISDLLSLPGGEEAMQKITDRQPMGICSPDDIAKAVIFLLSSSARMITGICLPVDGGKLAT